MEQEIRHANIFYVNCINVIGGVETYINEILKKYHDLDICVVYKNAHPDQLKRIKRYCRAYKHTGQKLVCDVCVINYDISIIPFICESAKIYQGIHADYDNEFYIKNGYIPPTHPRITAYIAITKHIAETFSSVSGEPQNRIIQIYNPLSIDPPVEKPLILVSATRLSPEKGETRMRLLAEALDKSGVNYIWFIFTDSNHSITSPNVVYKEPTLEIGKWLDYADYLVQLSDTEGLSYSINEMLYRNKPCILTPLHYLDEIGVKDGVNAYIMEMDGSNVDEIARRITKIPKFKFKQLDDSYEKILKKSKSHYEKDKKTKVPIRCTYFLGADLIQEQIHADYNDVVEVSEDRAEELLRTGCFEDARG